MIFKRTFILGAMTAITTLLATPSTTAAQGYGFYDRNGRHVGSTRAPQGDDRIRIYDRDGRRNGYAREGSDGQVRVYDNAGRRVWTAVPRR